MCDIEKYQRDGYVICENIFSSEELDACKEEINAYVRDNPSKIVVAEGLNIVDFLGRHNLPITHKLKDSHRVHDSLKMIFGDNNYRFCSHNDIGINRVVGWHKDKLNNNYAKYQIHDIWAEHEGEKHEIVKVAVYLQDHGNNNGALQVVPGSHLQRELKFGGSIYLHPKKGDVVIFDQRITHRGMDAPCADTRILVSMGFGKNNIFTDEFEQGTILRQNYHNKINT
jgi:ectoine hydroxylase-related dioxygenase (phytanoyl-CoA dioxygenase family)